MKYRIGIDLGGTKTELILTQENPLDVVKRIRIPTGQEKGYDHIVRQISTQVKQFMEPLQTTPLIGIGIPGTLNPATGLVRNSNTQCLIGKPLQKDLSQSIGLEVKVENDANCFALSEALFGAGRGYGRVMGIIMGTGMGGGIVENGLLWKGAMGIAGEFGHSTINFNGPQCWCGNRGCLEMYISGTAAEANYRAQTGLDMKLEQIYQQSLDGSSDAATQTINDLVSYFGVAMGNLISCFDPDILVIGGGVSNLPVLYTQGKEAAQQHIFNHQLSTPIVQNQLGDSSGVYGAALLHSL